MAISGDILFCVRGNTLGRQNVADQDYAIGRGIAAIRARQGRADSTFISHWLRQKAAKILAAGNGSTFPSVSGDYLEALPFPAVTLPEQQRIAACLAARLAVADTAYQAARCQASEVNALWHSIYRNAFRGVVPIAVPPNFGERPLGWAWH